MNKTLEENGIPDESENFSGLNIESDFCYPAVHIYFKNDEDKQL